jgi:hypothetical protein
MSCPRKVNLLPISKTESPVTVTAEVLVNNALTNEISPLLIEFGSNSNNVPTKIKKTKELVKIIIGDKCLLYNILINSSISGKIMKIKDKM